MQTAIIIPADHPDSDLPTATTSRLRYHVDELAQALGATLGIDVPVVEGTLADAPAGGYLLVFGDDADADARLSPRIVAFDADRSTIMTTVERHSLAGAIEKHRYFQWYTRRGDDRGAGVIGRKDIAAAMQARTLGGPYTSEHYAMIASDTATDLVTLLAEYLTAYARVVRA
jgi:hypothetical protein